MEIKLKSKTKRKAYKLLTRMSLTKGYWRKAGELDLLRKLRINGLVRPVSPKYKPQTYNCGGQCFYKLTPQGLSLVEQQGIGAASFFAAINENKGSDLTAGGY